jgi:hypothetical protein
MRQYVGKTKKTLAYRHGVHRTEMWEQKSLLGIHLVHCYKGKKCENNQLGVRELDYMEKLGGPFFLLD